MRKGLPLLALGLLLLLPGAAEARGKGKRREKTKETEVVTEGKVVVVRGLRGGEPQIADDKGKRWLMVGALQGELVRLSGHRIKVWATAGEKKVMMPTLKVRRYEILDSGGGQKPLVGMLRQEPKDQRYVLERDEGNLTITASDAFKRQLARRVGCKIWIVGDLEGTTLKARKFGWLNCKPPKVIKPRKETSK
jgi:hypothetical protein